VTIHQIYFSFSIFVFSELNASANDWSVDVFRLARTVQKQTENCPDKAKKMQLKLNKMEAPFKQVS